MNRFLNNRLNYHCLEVNVEMNEDKPLHFDGSLLNLDKLEKDSLNEPIVLTDEMRANISGNPYMNQSE